MASEVLETTIGEVLSQHGGSVKTGPFGTTLKAKEYSTDGVPLISVGEIGYGAIRVHPGTPRVPREVVERLPEYLLEHRDIVFGRKGAVDRSAMVKPGQAGWFLGSDGIRLRLPKSCDAQFVAYHLQAPATRTWLVQHATGTTMASLNQGTIERIPVRLPPLSEQRAIAHTLGTLDDKIELNRRMNETLEAMARALFKSWFVDFDPVRAKAEGRDPGLPPAFAGLFPSEFEESELGEIPNGWELQRFADTVDIIGGGTPKTSVVEYWNGDIPWFSVIDAPNESDVWVVDTAKHITRAGVQNSSTRILSVGTTIISARGTVGRVALVAVPMAMNQSCYGLRGKAGINGNFTYFTTRELVTRLQQHAHGSVFDTITQDTLAGVSLASPPSPLIEAFETRVGPALERIRANVFSSRTLAALRDALLPKLISGELRVRDAERFVERAV
ncbi:MAG: restriction endonuclease subunit S [Dehalococcoidia bacterium]|nr:restriction endonuclease subunit S [Dehalococcoidia bacterium]